MPASLPRRKAPTMAPHSNSPPDVRRLRRELEALRVEQDMTRSIADDVAAKAEEAVRDLDRE